MPKLRVMENGMLHCPSCNEKKTYDHFAVSNSVRNTIKRAYLCKECAVRKTKAYRNTETGFWVGIWNNLNSNAKARKLSVGITKNDIIKLWKAQDGLCALTKIPMQTVNSTRTSRSRTLNQYRASVDRIDSEKGYITGNVRLVCAYVNVMRSDMTDDELRFWCAAILKGSNNG
jgi:uncharacterized protein YlaI